MSDIASADFLRLIKFSFDVSSDVLRAYTNAKLIDPHYGGSFIRFLDKKKHEFYHKWQSSVACCCCGDNFNPTNTEMPKWIFNQLYEINSEIKCNHRHSRTKDSVCLCRVLSKQSLSLDELDISVINWVLKACFLSNSHTENIAAHRDQLCHVWKTDKYTKVEYENVWKILEASTLSLAAAVNIYYHKSIQYISKTTRKYDVPQEEVLNLVKEIETLKMLMNVKSAVGVTPLPENLSMDLKDIEIVEGCDARFELWTTNVGVEVKWFKGENEIEMSDKYVVHTLCQIHSLAVTKSTLTDRGIYMAKFLGYTRSARLDIKEYFTTNLDKNVDCIEGDKVDLFCEVMDADATAEWAKNGVVLHISEKYEITMHGKIHNLSIRQVELQDAGIYVVKINNRLRATSLQVKEYFTRNFEKNVECFGRDKVTLSCEVLDTDATAEWSKDGVVLHNKEKYELTKLGKAHTLSIVNAEFQDAGVYTVKINNRERSTTLNVKELPEAIKRMSEEEKHQFIELIKSGVQTEKRYSFRTVIVGKFRAGKTCLRRRLMKETKNDILKTNNDISTEDGQPQSSTDGVDIDVRSSRIPIRDGEVVKNRDWIVDHDQSVEMDHRLSMVYAKKTKTDISITPNSNVTASPNTPPPATMAELSPTSTVETSATTMVIPAPATMVETSQPTTILEPPPTTTIIEQPQPIMMVKPSPPTMEELSPKTTLVQLPEYQKQSTEVNNHSKLPKTKAVEKHQDIVLKSTEFQKISNAGAQHIGNDDTTEENRIDDDTEIHLLNLIEKMNIEMPLKITEDEYAFSKLWDLSGQKNFYATHQVFLTCAAIYLLTVDLSDDLTTRCKPDNQYRIKDFQSVGEYIDFWLDSIHCYSSAHITTPKSSIEQTPKSLIERTTKSSIEPPVIVVCTHTDKYETCTALQERQAEFDTYFWKLARGQDKGKHINQDIIYLSNTTDPDERFADLRRKISEVARSMNAWGEEIPQKWILMEKAIEQIRTKSNVVRLSFILKVGKLNIVGIDNENDIKLFLRYQHEIGNIIFFNEKYLEEFVIVSPTWLIDAFKCIVSHKIGNDIKQTDDWGNLKVTGIMTDSLLDKLLEKVQGLNVPRTKVHVVRCLEKFDILIPVDDRKSFYVPSMMRKMELSNLMTEIMTDPSNWKKTSWLVLNFDFLPPQFFQHIIAFFTKIFIPNDRNGKTDLYRGIGLFNLGPKNSPEKLAMCVSLHMIAMQGWVCTSNNRDFKENYSRIRLLLEKIVLRIKRRYSLNIHYLIEFSNLLIHDGTDDCVTLEHLVYLDSCGSLYNRGDTNYNPREIYDKWYTESHNRKNTYIICLRHNLEWASAFNVFLKKIEYWNVCSINTVCTCYEAHEKVWNNVSKEHIAVAHEVYKKSEEFRTSTDCRNVSFHEEFYSKLLEKDMFLGHTKSSADRLIYVLFIENRGFKKCEYDGMFSWNIFDYLKDPRFNQKCHDCDRGPSVYWCHDGQRSMCQDCNNQHMESEDTKDHIVQHVQDIYSLDNNFTVNVMWMRDIKILHDGLLVIAVDNCKQLLTCHLTGQHQNTISLSHCPYRLGVVDNNKVAVTLFDTTTLVIVDVREKQVIQHIDAQVECRGIMYKDNQLFLGCRDSTIRIRNMEGEVTRTIPVGVVPMDICSCEGGRICYNDHNKLYFIDTKGNALFTFTDRDMREPLGITTDDEGHVLVICNQSNNVLRISPDGTHSQVVITKLPPSYDWPHICYDSLSKSIVFSRVDNVYIYKKV